MSSPSSKLADQIAVISDLRSKKVSEFPPGFVIKNAEAQVASDYFYIGLEISPEDKNVGLYKVSIFYKDDGDVSADCGVTISLDGQNDRPAQGLNGDSYSVIYWASSQGPKWKIGQSLVIDVYAHTETGAFVSGSTTVTVQSM